MYIAAGTVLKIEQSAGCLEPVGFQRHEIEIKYEQLETVGARDFRMISRFSSDTFRAPRNSTVPIPYLPPIELYVPLGWPFFRMFPFHQKIIPEEVHCNWITGNKLFQGLFFYGMEP